MYTARIIDLGRVVATPYPYNLPSNFYVWTQERTHFGYY